MSTLLDPYRMHQSVHDLAVMAGEMVAVALRRVGQPVPVAPTCGTPTEAQFPRGGRD